MPIKIIKDSLEQDFEITTNDNIDGRDIYNNNERARRTANLYLRAPEE